VDRRNNSLDKFQILMRKYLITNPLYSGHVAVLYNAAGLLVLIDFAETSMGENYITAFKAAVPAHSSQLASAFKPGTTIVEAALKITWEEFYEDWPYKRNAFLGKKIWVKMNEADKVIAYYNKKDYISYCKRQQSKYDYQPMMVDRYLRQREFETEWKKLK
jgi:hypothetical protein